MNAILDDPARVRGWPLHPQPTGWEDLETWVRRIAGMYGVSYDAFLLNALGHTGCGARDLDQAPAGVIAKLSVGTGIPIERLLDMTSPRILTQAFRQAPKLCETPQGQKALERIEAIASRRRRRRSAVRGF